MAFKTTSGAAVSVNSTPTSCAATRERSATLPDGGETRLTTDIASCRRTLKVARLVLILLKLVRCILQVLNRPKFHKIGVSSFQKLCLDLIEN